MKFIFSFIFVSFLFSQHKCDFNSFNQEMPRAITPSWQEIIYSPSGDFSIHFDTTGTDAPNLEDLNENGIPDYVDLVGTTIDFVKIMLCDLMGYKEVPAENEPAYPIYISNRSNGSYGVNYSEGQTGEAPYGWVEIDNNYFVEEFTDLNGNGHYDSHLEEFVDSNGNGVFDSEGYYTSGIEAMQVTVAHEYFHAVQRKYRQPIMGESYFYEFSSTWVEDLIFPGHDDYIYWIDDFNNSPTTAFNYTDGYSVASFGHYLNTVVEEFEIDNIMGNNLIRTIWERMENVHSEDPIEILNDNLISDFNTTFMDSWSDFIARNYFNGSESNFHYYPDQINMQYISFPNPISFNSIHSENMFLFDDKVSIFSVETNLSGMLSITHNGDYPFGKIVKIGQNEEIFDPIDLISIPMHSDDVLKFVYFSDLEMSIELDFELLQTPTTPYNITTSELDGNIQVQWNSSFNVGDSLKYFVFRNNSLYDFTYNNFYLDDNAEILEEYFYQVQAWNENGYSGISSSVSMILWHNSEQMKDNQIISIYPNGYSLNDDGLFMVLDSDQIFQNSFIQLYNIKGQLKNNFNISPLVKGRQRINLTGLFIQNLASGLYILNFCFDESTCSTHKITWLK